MHEYETKFKLVLEERRYGKLIAEHFLVENEDGKCYWKREDNITENENPVTFNTSKEAYLAYELNRLYWDMPYTKNTLIPCIAIICDDTYIHAIIIKNI